MLDHGQNIISRGLPKTGARAFPVYRAGDDDTYQSGWWRGRTIANTRQRFKSLVVGGEPISVDRATRLMWPRDHNSGGCNWDAAMTWNNAIDYCEALNYAGFTDWRLPNVNEMHSIVDHNILAPAIWSSFWCANANYWTSTTTIWAAASAWLVFFSFGGYVFWAAKTGTNRIRAVRDCPG